MSNEALKEAGAKSLQVWVFPGEVTLSSRQREGPGARKRGRQTMVIIPSCVTLVTMLVPLSSFSFQSLSEKIEAQQNWVSQRDHGRAGLEYLCPRRSDCFPGSVCWMKFCLVHRASYLSHCVSLLYILQQSECSLRPWTLPKATSLQPSSLRWVVLAFQDQGMSPALRKKLS